MKQNNMKVPAICHLLVNRPVHLHFSPCSTHFSCFNQHIRSFGCKTFFASVIYELKIFIALHCRALDTSKLCNECLFEVLIHDNDSNCVKVICRLCRWRTFSFIYFINLKYPLTFEESFYRAFLGFASFSSNLL